MYNVAQANIYINIDNKEILKTHIIEISDHLNSVVQRYQSDYPNFRIYLDNYEKLFAQPQELIEVPKGQDTERFLECVFILSLKKTNHRVITFFLLRPQQNQYILHTLPQVMDQQNQNQSYIQQQQFNQAIITMKYLQDLNEDLDNIQIENKSIKEFKIYSVGFIKNEHSYQISYTDCDYIGILTSFQVDQVGVVEKIENQEKYSHIHLELELLRKPLNGNKFYCVVKIKQKEYLSSIFRQNKQIILLLNTKIPAFQFPLSQEIRK